MRLFFDLLIWSALVAIVSLFYFWQAWIGVGIITFSARLIHWRTRDKLPQPQPNLPSWELWIFYAIPSLILSVDMLLRPFNLDRTTNQIIVLGMVIVELGAAIGLLWRHRHEVSKTWGILLWPTLWTSSFIALSNGRADALIP